MNISSGQNHVLVNTLFSGPKNGISHNFNGAGKRSALIAFSNVSEAVQLCETLLYTRIRHPFPFFIKRRCNPWGVALGTHQQRKKSKTLRSVAKAKAVGPYKVPVEGTKRGLHHDLIVLTRVWHEGLQRLRYAVIRPLCKTEHRTECGSYRGIPLVVYACKVFLEIAAPRIG